MLCRVTFTLNHFEMQAIDININRTFMFISRNSSFHDQWTEIIFVAKNFVAKKQKQNSIKGQH